MLLGPIYLGWSSTTHAPAHSISVRRRVGPSGQADLATARLGWLFPSLTSGPGLTFASLPAAQPTLPSFGINVILNYDHVALIFVGLIIAHDKIIMLNGT
jgi:hypothetical protein